MLTVTRIKSTNTVVYPLGASGPNHTFCLFTTGSKKVRGVVQPVRNDKLVKDREELF